MKQAIRVALIVLTIVVVVHPPAVADSTEYSAVIGFHVNLDKHAGAVQFIRVKLNDGEWYQFESDSGQLVGMYQSLVLTAIATGREIKIYWTEGKNDKRMIGSIYLR